MIFLILIISHSYLPCITAQIETSKHRNPKTITHLKEVNDYSSKSMNTFFDHKAICLCQDIIIY